MKARTNQLVIEVLLMILTVAIVAYIGMNLAELISSLSEMLVNSMKSVHLGF